MFKIGCHLSSSKGYMAMGKEAVSIGANTFQFFTRNPRGGAVKPLDLVDISAYQSFSAMRGLQPILAHAPYTLNACAADAGLRQFALGTIKMVLKEKGIEKLPSAEKMKAEHDVLAADKEKLYAQYKTVHQEARECSSVIKQNIDILLYVPKEQDWENSVER